MHLNFIQTELFYISITSRLNFLCVYFQLVLTFFCPICFMSVLPQDLNVFVSIFSWCLPFSTQYGLYQYYIKTLMYLCVFSAGAYIFLPNMFYVSTTSRLKCICVFFFSWCLPFSTQYGRQYGRCSTC